MLRRPIDIIKNHYGDHVRSTDLSPMQIAAHHAFSAGNIQLVKVGHAPDLHLHSIDIASHMLVLCNYPL
jgi:hypothetical protein